MPGPKTKTMSTDFTTKLPPARTGDKLHPGKYVDLLIDGNFKLIFSKEKNKPVLIELLNAFLPVHIASIDLRQQERTPRRRDLKTGVFDLYCKTSEGRNIVVEVQYNSRKDYLDRMLYYATWPISEQKFKNENNYLLDEVYVISFVNFALVHDSDWPEGKAVSSYSIREDGNGELMTGALHFVYVELGRFLKEEDGIRSIDDWFMYCLKNMGRLGGMPGRDVPAPIASLLDITKIESLPPDERNKYDSNMQNEFDKRTEKILIKEEAFAAGKAEGEASGIAAGKAEIAKAMKADGISAERIAHYTGLPESEIQGLE